MRVLIADNHRILCDGLRQLLEQREDIEVVGCAGDGRDAVRLARELAPDVVIMDVAMPGLNGIEATRQVRAEAPGTRVLALSMHADKRYVSGMLVAGASGYVLKDCAYDELEHAVRVVQEGKVYLSPSIAGVVMDDYLERIASPAAPSRAASLSSREREVIQLLAEGRSTRQIAALLHLSHKTVETHRRNVLEKLGLQGLAELTKFAIREGLTTLEEPPRARRRR